MKLTKNQAQEICENYSLGKIKKFKLMGKGFGNNNFDFKTDKGNFIIRFVGEDLPPYKKRTLKLEVNTLIYVRKKDFPYNTPFPLENKNGKRLSKMGKQIYWVYKKLEGSVNETVNEKKFKEIVKLQAIYDKLIKNFKVHRVKDDFFTKVLPTEYSKMKKIQPKDKLDKHMLKNIELFEAYQKKVAKIKFPGKPIAIHADLKPENILFRGNKIVALLDFGNVKIEPRIVHLGTTVDRLCFDNGNFDKKRFRILLREYEKTNLLTKKEKELIYYPIIKDLCGSFWWFYAKMDKRIEMKEKVVKLIIKKMKSISDEIKKVK